MKLAREAILYFVLLCSQQTSAFTMAIPKARRASCSFVAPPSATSYKISRVASTTVSLEAFAESLEEDEEAGLFDDADDADVIATWQEQLEMLLDPDTPAAKRQILLSDLVSSNESIRQDVQKAVSERKIDAILTPTGKKLQDGTKAVARQITTDIIPGLADIANTISSGRSSSSIVEELPSLVPKVGERVLDAMRTTAKKNLETLQGDLADPTRIPGRLSKQRADIETEVRNIFLETPVGLQEPEYSVLEKGIGYEIRQYEGYTAAAASMSKIGESVSVNDLTSGGAAFNSLAAYLFGANEDEKGMEMTTPVTTTSAGEMRFYLKNDDETMTQNFPTPLAVEDKLNEKGAVKLIDVPPARLAVARFTGFVTDGEVARQKDALLSALAADGVEIDVPHGAVVPYFVFQYNPPYTIPIVRRNEIAVPVLAPGEVPAKLEEEWLAEDGIEGENNESSFVEAPSDVEGVFEDEDNESFVEAPSDVE